MSYQNPRIKLTDSAMDMLTKMSGGNPGALSVLMKSMEAAPKIDPDSALGPFGPMLQLDTLDIYDSEIWILYKDVCCTDLTLMLALLRAVQLGIMPEMELRGAIHQPQEFTSIRGVQLIAAVKEQLPDFGGAS